MSLTEPSDVRRQVDAALREGLDSTSSRFTALSPSAEHLMRPILDFTASGKRIRALAAWWGFEIAGGSAEAHPGIANAAAAVELLHAAALIHDDVIDASDTRRGAPSVHRQFEALHRNDGFAGDSEHFGIATAIVAGDLCLALSEEFWSMTGLPDATSPAALEARNDLRRDVMFGQFLDIYVQDAPVPAADVTDRAWEVLTYKTAKYSVEQPFAVGASIAGADEAVIDALRAFALPLGRAFQLRDDELGVFGDPEVTGKPAGDDLRQGKKTVLVGYTLEALPEGERDWFVSTLAAERKTAEDIARMTDLIRSSGALERMEQLIAREVADSEAALDRLSELGLDAEGHKVLRGYAQSLTVRSS